MLMGQAGVKTTHPVYLTHPDSYKQGHHEYGK